jgi:hypothetical protein
MTTIVTIDMGGTGATHAAGAREALSVPSMTDMGQSYAQANSARDQANTARDQANTARNTSNNAYAQANTGRSDANTTFASINTTFETVNTSLSTMNINLSSAQTWANIVSFAAYGQANTARGTANDAYAQANAGYIQANAAYGAANTRLSASGGTLSGDLIITGNLTVSGNQTILNTEVLTTEDADIILLSNTSSTPALNAGLIINRGTSTNTFLRWDEALDEWGWSDSGNTTYYFEDLRQGLSTTNTTFGTVNTSLGTINTSYQAAYAQANTAGTNAGNAYGQANAAYAQANSAYGAANNRVLKAGDTMTGQLNVSSGGLLVTGNVGFGMPSPIFPLQVKTNTGTPPQALQLNTTDWTTTIGSAFQFGFGAATGNTYSEIRALSGGYNAWNNLVLQSGGGSVGIGTTSPSRKFDVIGDSNSGVRLKQGSQIANALAANTFYSGLVFENQSTSHAWSMGYNQGATFSINWFDADANTFSNRFLIASGGAVGIGTTSPSTKLHLYESGAADVLFRLTAANGTYDPLIQFTGQGNDITAEGFEIWYDNDVGDVHLSTTYPNDGATIHFHTRTGASKSTSNERLTILGNGNVGIATTSPQSKLEVATSSNNFSHFGATSTANGQFTGITLGYRENNSFYRKAAIVQEQIGDNSARGHLHLLVDIANDSGSVDLGDSKLMIHGTTGNVGIGTASPSNKLHVYGSIRAGIAGNSNANYAALEVASSGTGDEQAAIAIQQVTSEGDTIIFADYEPFVEWGISTENGSNLIQFTAGSGTNSLGTKTLYNRSGTARTAHTKFQVNLSNGDTIIGGAVGIGTASPATKLNVLVGAGGSNGTAGIRIGGLSNYESLELGILDNYGAMFRSYGNDMHYYSGHWRTVGTGASEDHAHYWYTSKTGSANWSTAKLILDADGALKPGADNTYNLGTSSLRWANIYTADLNMSNKGSQNDIDGTWGEWTIQEGEEDLFLLNRRNGKKYKFMLKEIE